MPVESVKVVVRVRPFSNYELEHKSDCIVSCSGDTVNVQAGSEVKSFTYDATYWSVDGRTARYASQDILYEDLGASMLANAFDGYNCCIFAYGQTGSGKSYTLLGFGSEASDLGIIPRTVEAIFAAKSAMDTGPNRGELRVWASSAEIYNERIRDLLQPNVPSNELKILDHPELGVCIPGLVSAACVTAADIRKLWAFSNRKRATTATNMNAASSRSHAAFMIKLHHLEGPPPRNGAKDERKITSAQLHFIDLAGSERLSPTAHSTRIKEKYAINASLYTLSNLIKVLSDQQFTDQRHQILMPFRASKLTFMMKDALSGNSKTTLIATITPASDSLSETLSTLRFAESTKPLKTNPVRNVSTNTDQIAHALQAEVRQLKSRRSSLVSHSVDENGSSPSDEQHREEIAQRELLLTQLTTSYEQQLEEAVVADRVRDEALRKLGLTSSLIDEVFGIESNTPYMLNMSSDPMLVGCLIYFLHPGVKTRIGASLENNIVLTGLGMPDFLCTIENVDQQTITLSAAESLGTGNIIVKANVRTNGSLLLIGETRRLQHLDYLIFGRAHAMRLMVPSEQKRLAGSDVAALRAAQGLFETNMLRLLIPEESEAWNELRLYFEDLWQRLGEERGRVFFTWLIEASHLVDEANEITAELRPEDRLKFEVELVWDIHRAASDIIVIRAMQFPVGEGDAAVLCYWTLETFKDRVVMMRDCFDVYHQLGEWSGKGDPLEDPWMDPSAAELRLCMQIMEDAELKAQSEMAALLEAEDGLLGVASLGKTFAIASGLSGPSKPMPKRRSGVSTSSSKSGKSIQRHSSMRLVPQSRARLNGERISQAKKSPKGVSPPAWRGGGNTSVRSSSEERRAPPAMEKNMPVRPSASPGSRQRACDMSQRDDAQKSNEPQIGSRQRDEIQKVIEPPQISEPVTFPCGTPPTRPSPQPSLPFSEPDAEPSTKDAIIAALKQQLVDKERNEVIYKEKLKSLSQKLAARERQHGSLISLASEPDRLFTGPALRSISGGSQMLGSTPTLLSGTNPGLGMMMRSPTAATVPAMNFSSAPPQCGRTVLSGRLDTASVISSNLISDANTALTVGPCPQRMSSSRSSPAQTSETPLTTGNRSMTVPAGPSRQTSTASSFVAPRALPNNAVIATTTVCTMPVLYS